MLKFSNGEPYDMRELQEFLDVVQKAFGCAHEVITTVGDNSPAVVKVMAHLQSQVDAHRVGYRA